VLLLLLCASGSTGVDAGKLHDAARDKDDLTQYLASFNEHELNALAGPDGINQVLSCFLPYALHSPSLPHSFASLLTPSPLTPSLPHSLTPSLPHSLAPQLPHLPHSPTRSLTPSLTPLLTQQEAGTLQTPLMAASLAGQANAVDTLLSMGADYTIPEKDGYNPPHGVAFQGRAEAARMLIKHKAGRCRLTPRG